MKKIGLLISGRGSNFEAIARNVQAGKIPAEIGVVISNKEDAVGLAIARQMGLNAVCIPSKGKEREAFERELVACLQQHEVDLVCLAGFMRVLTAYFIREFKGRILNIHPALLPAFKGGCAIKDAFDYGVKVTGVTVHFVDGRVDHGPIVVQEALVVREAESVERLEERIHRIEHKIYADAIRRVLAGRYAIRNRKVVFIGR